ncbi:hypothetical protein M3Y99_01749000 [Aphelenchoides fujianensis]|nr:hypothetical protein M3Y99_01749000 [Aphelenchoides fujianensis]
MYAAVRELVDFFVWPMFDGMPTEKVNMFAEMFANDMLVTIMNETVGDPGVQIRKDENGFWVFRDGPYLMPALAGALEKCGISVPEFFACFTAQRVSVKMDAGAVQWLVDGQPSMLDLMPFKTADFRFEYPVRVLEAMFRYRLYYEEVIYGKFTPPNFVPLQLYETNEVQFNRPGVPQVCKFRAACDPLLLSRTVDQESLPPFGNEQLVNGNSPANVIKTEFFQTAWWHQDPYVYGGLVLQ